MKYLLLCGAAALYLISDLVVGYDSSTHIVMATQNISGAQTDTTAWIRIGPYHWFNTFTELSTTSASFLSAIGGDSVDFHVDYELYHGTSRPLRSTKGFRPKATGLAKTLMTFTSADTSFARFYQSGHDGTADFSPSIWIRFYIVKGTKHVTRNVSLLLSMYLVKQS